MSILFKDIKLFTFDLIIYMALKKAGGLVLIFTK